eukprot:TRINITY_DN28650_c0_g1_i1.p2 TRINITY_DN28650_c0_g1~~TRINITY_DN28650_c0_g1_i1.p2  ORF type:complete len:113 (-),score=0.27 TRINITY_DN28650_c0_g1_i1:48-386(-)
MTNNYIYYPSKGWSVDDVDRDERVNSFTRHRDESRLMRQERREKLFGKPYSVVWNKPVFEEYQPLGYKTYDNVFQEYRDRRRTDRRNLRLKIEERDYTVRRAVDPYTTHYFY